ncbi:MAG TPA: DNA integrity scanning protein DisA [Candidatus Hydrogenedentes bacterium]|nr:DNA integrity scanning protein DisA [Candidatus Hydrogenedentota bacterium]HIJ73120.1 DNA integrity scanning protein DisA [Candidatus Hydrogenedentota bacterium]
MAKQRRRKKTVAFQDAVKMISPGTRVREAISAILQSRMGALLCIGEPKRLAELSEGGVKVDAPCTPQLLYELCKMDGAIILNRDASRIAYANRFLKPDSSIPSDETGTRHRAAERLARQVGCTVVAVSERRSSVTVYAGNAKQVMDNIATLLNKATQAIQTLEKYINVLNQTTQDLTTREFQDMVTIFDVCRAVQRCEMVVRIAEEVEPYILELGTEGRLIELQLQELTIPVEEAELVIKDYYREKPNLNYDDVLKKVRAISQHDLLNLGHISQALGYGPHLRSVDTYLSPRGYRVLTQTHRLSPQIIESLVQRFGALQQIMRAPKDDLVAVEGVGEVLAERVRVSLNLLRNQLALDRR